MPTGFGTARHEGSKDRPFLMSAPESGAAPVASASSKRFDPRIWLLALGTFAVGTDNMVIAGILPTLAKDLNIGLDAAGQLVTVYSLAYGIGSPLLAAFTGKIRRERTAIWAIGVFALANVLCAGAPNYPALIAARILAGLAAALYTPSAYALAVSLAPAERRGRALSTVLFGISSSTLIGVPLGTVIGHRLGWHATFIFIAVLSAMAMTAMGLIRLKGPDVGLKPAQSSVASRLTPLARPAILLALLPALIWSIGNMVVFTYIAPILGPHFGPDVIAGLLLVNGIGGLVGGIAGGRLADRFGATGPIVASLAINALNLVLWGAIDGGLALTALAVLIYALCSWATGPSQQMRIIRIDPPSATVTLAINNANFYLGNSLGAILGGVLIAHVAPIDLTFVGAAFIALALGVFGLTLRAARHT